jgi:hypothetical protein
MERAGRQRRDVIGGPATNTDQKTYPPHNEQAMFYDPTIDHITPLLILVAEYLFVVAIWRLSATRG